MFEEHLRTSKPGRFNPTFNVADLLSFVDYMADLSVLMYPPLLYTTLFLFALYSFNPATREYTPHDKQWIKTKLTNHLKRSSARQ